ncbi:hypothetical protein HZB02_07730 [Candidatus Woesearchaeota archaeon]|nr:hypothetical protein [Candidatus Woesearchaeota archaeon]
MTSLLFVVLIILFSTGLGVITGVVLALLAHEEIAYGMSYLRFTSHGITFALLMSFFSTMAPLPAAVLLAFGLQIIMQRFFSRVRVLVFFVLCLMLSSTLLFSLALGLLFLWCMIEGSIIAPALHISKCRRLR